MIVQCSHCKVKLKLADSRKGTKVRCPKCKNVFVAQPVSSSVSTASGTVIAQCSHCKKKFKLSASKIGKKLRCPKCKNIFVVQAAPTVAKITVACSNCNAKLNVAESKLGKKLRCPKCKGVFVAKREEKAPPPIKESEIKTPEITKIKVEKETTPIKETTPTKTTETTKPIEEKTSVKSPRRRYGVYDERLEGMAQEERKAHEDAIRFAKALVSDIWMYNREKVDQGLKDGTITQLLGDEIKKSYKTYKMRVSPEIVNGTNYFKEALNQIIGKGKKLF